MEGIDMNIIRTASVELASVPAIAYKLKLPSGGAGIKLIRLDRDASAAVTLDKRTGEQVPYGPVDAALFPLEAFDEAAELLGGLPYSKRGNIRLSYAAQEAETEASEPEVEPEAPNMVDSDEYAAIVKRYADDRGKLNYTLMNKEFIQFAARGKAVAKLVGERAAAEVILTEIIKNRAAFISGKKDNLSDDEVNALIDTLDEIDPRSAFKELKAHIKRMLAKK